MAQERDIQADLGREGALSSGFSFQFLQGRNVLPKVGRRLPGPGEFHLQGREQKVAPVGAFIFQEALAGQWLWALVQIFKVQDAIA